MVQKSWPFLLNAHCLFSQETGSIAFEYGILPDRDGTIPTDDHWLGLIKFYLVLWLLIIVDGL